MTLPTFKRFNLQLTCFAFLLAYIASSQYFQSSMLLFVVAVSSRTTLSMYRGFDGSCRVSAIIQALCRQGCLCASPVSRLCASDAPIATDFM